jgi:molybdopterin converting factor subunit 1
MLKYNLFFQINFNNEQTITNFKIQRMKKIDVNILLFGITKDLVGKQKLQLQIPEDTTIADFKKLLKEKYPELVELDSLAIALNSEYATDEIVCQQNDEIALIPPVSGG